MALTHAIYPKLTPLLRARRKTESQAIAKTHTTNSKSHCARLIHHIQWHHQTLTKPNAQCCKTQKKRSDSHATNSKSHCARLIQHTHWHHQVLAKPCPHCVEHTENSFQFSHQRQQITLCTAHSTHQPLTHQPQVTHHSMENLREKGIWTRCWTRSEWDGNEIQALHLATFPFFLPQPHIIGKNTMFHGLPKISCARIRFLLTLSLPLFYSSLLCFSSFHIVGLLDPKLPLNIYTFQSLPHSDWWQHLQPSPNTAGTQTLSTSYNIQKITKSTKTWQNPVGTQNGTSFGRAARVRAST